MRCLYSSFCARAGLGDSAMLAATTAQTALERGGKARERDTATRVAGRVNRWNSKTTLSVAQSDCTVSPFATPPPDVVGFGAAFEVAVAAGCADFTGCAGGFFD